MRRSYFYRPIIRGGGFEHNDTIYNRLIWFLLTSIGVAEVPAAKALVAITLIITTIGLATESIALILAVDRVLDMCRTGVNVYSDSTAVGVIARSEGEALSKVCKN